MLALLAFGKKYWLQIAVSIVIAGAVWAAYNWAYDNGATDNEAKRLKKERAEVIAAADLVAKRSAEERAKERRGADALFDLGQKNLEELQNVKAEKDAVIGNLRSRGAGLRVPLTPSTVQAGGSGDGQAVCAAAGSNGQASGELPQTVSEDLIGLLSEADEVVKQLDLAQQTIIEDRKLCGDILDSLIAPPQQTSAIR